MTARSLLLIVAGFAAGAAITTSAQEPPALPFAIGQRIYIGPENLCTVEAVRGTFLKCSGGLPGEETWWNLTTIPRIRIMTR